MTPKIKRKKPSGPMTQKEFRAVLRRIDANLKQSKMLAEKMAPDLEALRRFVEDE